MRETVVIDSRAGLQLFSRLRECWRSREIMRMLSYRDIKVRYTQTALGMIWAVLNPLISVLILVLVFHLIAKVDTHGIPAVLFTVSGLLAWNYFSKVVAEAGQSIVGAQELVRKIYFPRLVIPVSKSFSSLIDFGVVLMMLLLFLLYYQYPVTLQILWMIPLSMLLIIMATGCGIWISALSIRFRDFHYIVPVLLRIGMFITPIAYSTGRVPAEYKWLLSLNPLTGIMEGFRFALFQIPPDPNVIFISIVSGMLVFISGLIYFLQMEKYIADII